MSYPSIHTQLQKMGATLENATDDQMQSAFVESFQEDLPLGFAKVEELVCKFNGSGKDRVMLSLDPKSPEGQQYARLLGPDVPRQVLERHFDVSFGFYNCCGGVVSDDKANLRMTMREQIEVQHPNFVDC
ncbi:MAG: hypothetical protein OXB96_02265 [Candidatus Kaiserbacteria bacterium]|nr:hypothetical protein [Candidatus Kaiserbacteria bacterium]